MINKLLNKIPKNLWTITAILIVVLVTGSEIAVSYELFALIDLLGADIFVLIYISGFLVMIEPAVIRIKTFLDTHTSLPSMALIKKDKMYLLFLLPDLTKKSGVLTLMIIATTSGIYAFATPYF